MRHRNLLLITLPAQPGPGWIYMALDGEWALATGQEHELQRDIALRRLRVRVLDGAGQPLADQRGTGTLEIYPAPPRPFHLQLSLEAKTHKRGPIDPPTASLGEATVRVPE